MGFSSRGNRVLENASQKYFNKHTTGSSTNNVLTGFAGNGMNGIINNIIFTGVTANQDIQLTHTSPPSPFTPNIFIKNTSGNTFKGVKLAVPFYNGFSISGGDTSNYTVTYNVGPINTPCVLSSATANPTTGVISVDALFYVGLPFTTDLVVGDILVTNGTAGNFVVVSAGFHYTFDVTPTAGNNVTVTIRIPSGLHKNTSGAANDDSNTLIYVANT